MGLIACLISFYHATGQIRPDATTDPTVFQEIDSLINVAQNQLKNNLTSAKEIARKANHLAVQNNYVRAYIQSTYIISVTLANTSQCRAALELLKQADHQAVKENDSLGMGLLSAAKGKCYYYLAVYDSAKIFHEKAIDLFLRSKANNLLASEYVQLSKVYLKSGDTKRASLYYSKAYSQQEKFPNADDHAWNRDLLGEIYHAQRLYDEAVAEHKSSQREFEGLKNRTGFASASLHTGNSYYMKVEDDSAKKYYNLALASYQALGDSNGIAICYTNLSRLALEGGDHQLAIDLANRAIATIHGGDYKLIETATLQQLGDIYLELEQYEKAILHINREEVQSTWKKRDRIFSIMEEFTMAFRFG